MNEQHTLGIFEAGISSVGEMEKLEKIIRPSIGLLTNIGEAHDAGFPSQDAKYCRKSWDCLRTRKPGYWIERQHCDK